MKRKVLVDVLGDVDELAVVEEGVAEVDVDADVDEGAQMRPHGEATDTDEQFMLMYFALPEGLRRHPQTLEDVMFHDVVLDDDVVFDGVVLRDMSMN
eukprot:3103955-Amphidinium_carterae.1